MLRAAGIISAAVITAASVAGCSAARASATSSIAATAAYVQVPSAPGKTTVGYLDIRNSGSASDELLSVTTSVGGTVQLRGPESPGASPVIMHTVPDIDIPAATMVQLVPNSYHLLITGARPLVDGKDITLSLKFARAGTVTVLALVTNPSNGGSSYFLN
ncbi:MAG TPA: copper chaperone PCu(A)C [Trebonia sp.]|jgi:copper(I)-binding protein|nr:copper chaperone PCu(A)C [Trebonia sp.]